MLMIKAASQSLYWPWLTKEADDQHGVYGKVHYLKVRRSGIDQYLQAGTLLTAK